MDPWDVVRFSSVAYCLAVVVVETRVLLRQQKFWPLAVDDYLVAAVLLAGVVLDHRVTLIVGWALALGSLYATLFARLDPAYRGVKRWGLLVVAIVWCGAGLALTLASPAMS
jgi:hypothetical protein